MLIISMRWKSLLHGINQFHHCVCVQRKSDLVDQLENSQKNVEDLKSAKGGYFKHAQQSIKQLRIDILLLRKKIPCLQNNLHIQMNFEHAFFFGCVLGCIFIPIDMLMLERTDMQKKLTDLENTNVSYVCFSISKSVHAISNLSLIIRLCHSCDASVYGFWLVEQCCPKTKTLGHPTDHPWWIVWWSV